MSGDNGLMSQADRMLSREARLEDLETVARLLAEVAALRAKAAKWDEAEAVRDAFESTIPVPVEVMTELRAKAAAADRVREWAAMHDDMARQYDEAALSVRTLALVDEAQGHAEDCRAIAEGVRRALDGPSPC